MRIPPDTDSAMKPQPRVVARQSPGLHLIGDLYGCRGHAGLMTDAPALEAFCKQAVLDGMRAGEIGEEQAAILVRETEGLGAAARAVAGVNATTRAVTTSRPDAANERDSFEASSTTWSASLTAAARASARMRASFASRNASSRGVTQPAIAPSAPEVKC